MIIQEIEKYRADIKAVQDSIDHIYGLYIVHFPEMVAEMQDLRAMQAAKQSARSASDEPDDDGEPTLTHLPDVELSDCKDLAVIPEAEVEEGEEEEEELEEVTNHAMRERYKHLHRKCLSLCHPDKTAKFESSVRIKLHDLFYEVRDIQRLFYHSQLITYYVMIRILRREEHLLDESMLVPMRRELQALKQDFDVLLMHELCKVIVYHREGRRLSAMQEFEAFLLKQMETLKNEIREA